MRIQGRSVPHHIRKTFHPLLKTCLGDPMQGIRTRIGRRRIQISNVLRVISSNSQWARPHIRPSRHPAGNRNNHSFHRANKFLFRTIRTDNTESAEEPSHGLPLSNHLRIFPKLNHLRLKTHGRWSKARYVRTVFVHSREYPTRIRRRPSLSIKLLHHRVRESGTSSTLKSPGFVHPYCFHG